MADWIPPPVILALILVLRRDLSARIDRIDDRFDRHLGNHPACSD